MNKKYRTKEFFFDMFQQLLSYLRGHGKIFLNN